MIYLAIIITCLTIFGIAYLCIKEIEIMNSREYDLDRRRYEIEMRKVMIVEKRDKNGRNTNS